MVVIRRFIVFMVLYSLVGDDDDVDVPFIKIEKTAVRKLTTVHRTMSLKTSNTVNRD